MKVIKNNNITVIDCDETLVLYKNIRTKTKDTITFEYGNELLHLTPHNFHPTFVKHCFLRGDFVIIWSKNGWQWSQQIALKLGLDKYCHIAMSKPKIHVDDKHDISSICGDRVFIPEYE